MKIAPLTCRDMLDKALPRLIRPGAPMHWEAMVNLVDTSMTGLARYYHTLPHALSVAESDDPIDMLIGLCHDIVQTEVDDGLPEVIEQALHGFITHDESGVYRLVDDARTRTDRSFEMVRIGFGLERGQALPARSGRNEFLSALSAVKTLEHLLNPAALASLTIGIEATIPFRSDPDNVAYRSCRALQELNRVFDLELSDAQIRDEIRRSVRMANRDISSFCGEDLHTFLDDTWNLMRETSQDLRHFHPIPVRRYRATLQKMTRFLSGLRADVVFRRFEDEPDSATWHKTLGRAADNLAIISAVMGAKLLAASLIEATRDSHETLLPTFPPQAPASRPIREGANSAESILSVGKDSPFEFDICRSRLAYRVALEIPEADVAQIVEVIDPTSAVSPALLQRVPEHIAKYAISIAGDLNRH